MLKRSQLLSLLQKMKHISVLVIWKGIIKEMAFELGLENYRIYSVLFFKNIFYMNYKYIV